jgi:hypothetical protein
MQNRIWRHPGQNFSGRTEFSETHADLKAVIVQPGQDHPGLKAHLREGAEFVVRIRRLMGSLSVGGSACRPVLKSASFDQIITGLQMT